MTSVKKWEIFPFFIFRQNKSKNVFPYILGVKQAILKSGYIRLFQRG